MYTYSTNNLAWKQTGLKTKHSHKRWTILKYDLQLTFEILGHGQPDEIRYNHDDMSAATAARLPRSWHIICAG